MLGLRNGDHALWIRNPVHSVNNWATILFYNEVNCQQSALLINVLICYSHCYIAFLLSSSDRNLVVLVV